jgi:hypothetical protein
MNIKGMAMNFRSKRTASKVVNMGELLNPNPNNSEFNWQKYLDDNPHLMHQGIVNKDLAYYHWMNYGKANRMVNPENEFDMFDWVNYLSNNADLTNAGIMTKDGAYKHWKNLGESEGRVVYNEKLKFQYETMITNKRTDIVLPNEKNLKYFSNNATSILDSNKIKKIETYKYNFVSQKLNAPPQSFILIVDFPNYGGGTMFFLNTIISNYKHKCNFVVARNFKGNVFFYLNDDFIINDAYDENEAILFINYYKSCVTKVFVNSVVGHKPSFLNAAFNLGKEITGITHDYSLLFDRPHYLYNEMEGMSQTPLIDINRFDRLITQNEANLSIYKKHIRNPNMELIVSPLPDFKEFFNKTSVNNKKIVVGIMGYISDIKGQHLVKRLIDLSEKQGRFEVVIFGRTNIFYEKQYEYGNINELNCLLNIYKPNLWVETSIWPETYSYTLSLMMLTQLPIFYQKKSFPSVIENRLSSYANAIPFDNIDSIDGYDLMSKSQNYFYNIHPNLGFNAFWDSYFGGPALREQSNSYNIVFISSKIYTSNVPFSYADKRSIYTTEERFNQTLATIDSVRQYIPNSFIILFDNSLFPELEYNILNSKVNVFINNQSDKTIYNYTNVKTVKLYGELAQTAFVARYIRENLKYMNIQNFFKISGRYLINSTFNYSQYENGINMFKKNGAVTDRDYYYTSFYKIGRNFLSEYFDIIANMYNDSVYSPYDNYDWEVILPLKMNHNFERVTNLGITQHISAWNQVDMI